MIQLLLNIARKIKMSYTDLGKLDKNIAYKTLLKYMRKLLSKTHPDSGGDANEFTEIHELYEELLSASKNDKDNTGIAVALNLIANNASRLEKSCENIDDLVKSMQNQHLSDILDEIINDCTNIEIPRNKIFHVNIAELVTHFNTLKYCTMVKFDKTGPGRVFVNLKFVSLTAPLSDTIQTKLWADYTQLGKYTLYATINCDKGEKIEVQALGFDEHYVFEADGVNQVTATFKQNNIELELKIRVYMSK